MDDPETREGAPTKDALSNGRLNNNNSFSLQADGGESKTTLREELEAVEAAQVDWQDWPPEILGEWNRREREAAAAAEQTETIAASDSVEDNSRVVEPVAPEPEQNTAPSSHRQIVHYGNQLLHDGLPEAHAIGSIVAQLHFGSEGRAFPSIETLAVLTKKLPKTVRTILNTMEKRGHLKIVRRHGKPNIYIPLFKTGHAIVLS